MILGMLVGVIIGIIFMAMISTQSYQKGFEDGVANTTDLQDRMVK